jgi:hypothetical protein
LDYCDLILSRGEYKYETIQAKIPVKV